MFWKFLAILYLWSNALRSLDSERRQAEAEARRLAREDEREAFAAERAAAERERERTAPPRRVDLPCSVDWQQLQALVPTTGNRPLALCFPVLPGVSDDPARQPVYVVKGIDTLRAVLSPHDPFALRVYRHGAGRSSFRYLPLDEIDAERVGCRIVELPGDPQS